MAPEHYNRFIVFIFNIVVTRIIIAICLMSLITLADVLLGLGWYWAKQGLWIGPTIVGMGIAVLLGGNYFKAQPGTEGFRQEYQACLTGVAAPALDPGAGRAKPGSFDDLLGRYYRSPDFLDPSDRTRVVYRGVLERWRERTRKGVRYGDVLVRELQARHVEAMLAEVLPHRTAATMLRKRLSALMNFASAWRQRIR